VVTKLDRLARSVKHLLEITERVEAKKATLRILGSGIDTATPNGRLMLNLLGSIAQFEREITLFNTSVEKPHRPAMSLSPES
jgi:DNA invertase Pin-like site-specific DNA recombinase